MARECIIAGNWKMYKTGQQAEQFVQELIGKLDSPKATVYLAPPFTAIHSAAEAAKGSPVIIGAQNMHSVSEGAFTGEVAADMLKEAGAQFVILGHSERRHIFGENNTMINQKVQKAIAEGIRPILCVGEKLDEREAGKMEEVLKTQLTEGLNGVEAKEAKGLVIAYEPVWAIGTGKTASPKEAQEAHAYCRAVLEEIFNKTTAGKLPILYGGSVKPGNAKELLKQKDVDGVLVGGASLDVDSFAGIVSA